MNASELREHAVKLVNAGNRANKRKDVSAAREHFGRAAWFVIGLAHVTSRPLYSRADSDWNDAKGDAWHSAAGLCYSAGLFAEGAACARNGLSCSGLMYSQRMRLNEMLTACERGAK